MVVRNRQSAAAVVGSRRFPLNSAGSVGQEPARAGLSILSRRSVPPSGHPPICFWPDFIRVFASKTVNGPGRKSASGRSHRDAIDAQQPVWWIRRRRHDHYTHRFRSIWIIWPVCWFSHDQDNHKITTHTQRPKERVGGMANEKQTERANGTFSRGLHHPPLISGQSMPDRHSWAAKGAAWNVTVLQVGHQTLLFHCTCGKCENLSRRYLSAHSIISKKMKGETSGI